MRIDPGIDGAGQHALAVGDQVDRALPTGQQDVGLRQRVGRQPEHPREVVAPARGHHAERAAEPGHLTGERGEHPVATDGDHDVTASHGLGDQGRGRMRPRRIGDVDARAVVAQPPGDRDDGFGGGSAAGGRIDQEGEGQH